MEPITNEAEGTAEEIRESLAELARQGVRRIIVAPLEAEVEDYLQKLSDLRDGEGHVVAVRNGRAQERKVTTGAEPVKIRAPRVHDRRPDQRFSNKILPPHTRSSPGLEEALPVLYLRGLSTGDFQEALPVLLGDEAAGLSASTIKRLM